MGRWSWVVLVGVVGLVACGPESAGPPEETPMSEGQEPLPAQRDPGVPTKDPQNEVPFPIPEPEARPTPSEPVPEQSAPEPTPVPSAPSAPSAPGAPVDPMAYPPVQTRLPVVDLVVNPADLAQLEANPYAEISVPVVMVLDGERAPGKLSLRGASTRTAPQKSFKIELDKGYEFADRDHFHLLAQWYDSGKLTEKFAVDLLVALDLPVPRARYVKVNINGVPNGLYVDMEHVGKDYLKYHGLEKSASIYRCGARNCELTPSAGPHQNDFEKKTNETTGTADLQAFLEWVNRSDDSVFEAKLERHVDVEAYLGNLAADMLISNNIVEDSRSYWVHELYKDRWQYTPWDLNNALMLHWRTWHPLDPPITQRSAQSFSLYDPWVQRIYEVRIGERAHHRATWNVLNTRIWDRPALRARLIAKLEAALAGPFTEEKAFAQIDGLWALISPELARDPYVSAPHMVRSRAFLKQYVRERRAYLLSRLAELKAHGSGPLVIREVNAGSSGYVDVYNRGTTPINLEGYELTNDLRSATRHRLPAIVLQPNQNVRFKATGNTAGGPLYLPFTLSRLGGEVGLFNGNLKAPSGKPRMYGPEDTVYYGALPRGTVYGRTTPQSEDFERRPLGL
ncbi:MAG TPA: CotH kinase family protein [Myxococcaceae bacterium]|nr:CotH kinase family protein [Myxococcaceae bacterium]